ncbi:MAG TPA: 3-dehydroquinate synthase [Candidatus Nitrosotalea sp.]|nr:3-dehydroquinate synthase [Candidatus Nitrosotalea sp.]
MIEITVNLGPRSYPILVGAGILATVGSELAKRKVGRKAVLVTDPGIAALHGEPVVESLRQAGFDTVQVTVPTGEEAKRLEIASGLWDRLLDVACDRTSTVVALGGGAVGDLAGFVAATYMRGMNFVQVPTTLLAQVDASIGGKTAIDHPRGKNLIGAFYQPRVVIVDPVTLTTLPDREFRSGLAEVIKHGIVLDAAYFRELEAGIPPLLARDLPTLERVVAGSCRLKAQVVERDEQEAELRWVLNYGHTIGHALEAATGFRRWAHGEAVSLGIVAESRLAKRLGIGSADTADRQVRLLSAVGLPVKGLQVDPTTVMDALTRDKKSRDGSVSFVFAPEIGSFRIVPDVPSDAVLQVLKELR